MTRMRSPNFPALSLEEAIKLASTLHSKVRKTKVDREVAAKELGYSGLNGQSLRALGSLNQYGLIENSSKGQCNVTELAELAIHGFPDEEKAGAIQRAARMPPLFEAIYDHFGDDIASEHALKSFLIKRGFTDRGVDGALQSFLATREFANERAVAAGKGNIEQGRNGTLNRPLEPGEMSTERERATSKNSAQDASALATKPIYRDQPLEFSLSSKGLAITGGTNSASELRAFLKKLEAIAALLPDGVQTDHS